MHCKGKFIKIKRLYFSSYAGAQRICDECKLAACRLVAAYIGEGWKGESEAANLIWGFTNCLK